LGPYFTRDQPQHQTDNTAKECPRPGGTKHHSAAAGAAAQPAEQRTCYGANTYEHNDLEQGSHDAHSFLFGGSVSKMWFRHAILQLTLFNE
jgi:hypothetical protein